MLSESAWNAILQRQLTQLAQCTGVTITQQGFVNAKNPHRIYHDPSGDGNWKHGKGYQHIEFKLKCNAIMECDPRKRGNADRSAYRLKISDIKVQSEHDLICLFPRSFPHDPIGWGLYFKGKPPFYPNIMNLKDAGGYHVSRFSGDIVNLPNIIDGVICIGAASSSTGAQMHELVDNLRSYLQMTDPVLFKPTSQGGNNDGGFDGMLLSHFALNYDILKQALQRSPSSKTRLGGDKPKRKRLGS